MELRGLKERWRTGCIPAGLPPGQARFKMMKALSNRLKSNPTDQLRWGRHLPELISTSLVLCQTHHIQPGTGVGLLCPSFDCLEDFMAKKKIQLLTLPSVWTFLNKKFGDCGCGAIMYRRNLVSKEKEEEKQGQGKAASGKESRQ